MTGREAIEQLPVMAVMAELTTALRDHGAAVLVAPPGTGKTTGVPPVLAGLIDGRILVSEPRRLAARAAAARMAETAGEPLGRSFGYSVRGERRVSGSTRVELVTEGLLVRRLQADPSLDGVGAVLLDEFHERSIDADLALALLLDIRSSLRPDLAVVVMSATLDPAPVAALLGQASPDGSPAPVIEATAPMFPVEVRHRPGSAHEPLESRVATVVRDALGSDPGDVLVFLPGRPEIRRTARELERGGTPDGVVVAQMHGSLSPAAQDAVIRPDPQGRRRVVLSTSLAETSVTVPGVRVVIDAGRRRTVRTAPGSGLPALVTTAVSRAGADQRTGRAGRTAPGVSYRLWGTEDERHHPAADDPEIVHGDLAALVLQTRSWGVEDPRSLAWLDPPGDTAVDRAHDLLRTLGAIDAEHRLTPRGRELARVGFHPRLAAVAVEGRHLHVEALAAEVAAVLEAGRTGGPDLVGSVRELRSGNGDHEVRRAVRDWRRTLGLRGGDRSDHRASGHTASDRTAPGAELDDLVGRLLLAGFPDRVARRRPGHRTTERGHEQAVFVLRTGGEVALSAQDPLARAEWLVVADLDAGPPGAPGRAHQAAAVDAAVVSSALAEQFDRVDSVVWDDAAGDIRSRRQRTLGRIVVSDEPLRSPDPAQVATALSDALERHGPALLGRFAEADALRSRVACLRTTAPDPTAWPDWSEATLLASLGEWLGHHLAGARKRADLDRVDVRGALLARLDHQQRRDLDRLAPTRWALASGREVPLRYGEVDGDPATVLASVRLRDAIGTDVHPTVGQGRVPVTVELLSPAGRPVQRTTDLPGFWRGSYAAVRSELRGRYPKHPWPERPWEPLLRRASGPRPRR